MSTTPKTAATTNSPSTPDDKGHAKPGAGQPDKAPGASAASTEQLRDKVQQTQDGAVPDDIVASAASGV